MSGTQNNTVFSYNPPPKNKNKTQKRFLECDLKKMSFYVENNATMS